MSPAETLAIDYKALVQDDRIHASLYTDPRIFADEMDRIFHASWVFVGHDSEVPGTGDFVTRTLGREPVIMVRGQDGGVAVLVNRCMHRGTLLCPADRGRVRTFACPYHGWTYDLAGTLLGVPDPGGYASFDTRAHGLARAPRVASYRGFVFASLSAAGPTLAEHLGKGSLYARAGVPDYWIVTLVDRVLEIHRDPAPEPSPPWGWAYRSGATLAPPASVAPTAFSDVPLVVADLP
jgi:phenylpropionate dioxygenase-like ring-hydroxylating dioxygenase large terminal subunit